MDRPQAGGVTSLFMRAAQFAARILPSRVKQALYHLGPATTAIRSGLNRNAPAGITPVTVAGGLGRDLRLLLDLASEKEFWLGTYEPAMQAAIRRFVRPGAVVYDVGANIGYVSMMLALVGGPASQVFAFEPLPSNLERLRAHIEMNHLQDRVRVLPVAIGERSGRSRFLVHASGGMGKLEGSDGRRAHYNGAIDVETLALDDFVCKLGNPAPSVIKIDIEGGETKAILGMQRVLNEVRPVILIEIHGPEAGLAVWDAFERADYQTYSMSRPETLIEAPEVLGWKAYVIGLPRERRNLERG
jgi:FkbM family methyltransferase